MKTIAEIRLANLKLLIDEFVHHEVIANSSDTSAVYLSQVVHQTPDSKTGRPREIGDKLARKLEIGCEKEHGWMDNHHYASGDKEFRMQAALKVMEQMAPYEFDKAFKMLNVLAEPRI